MRRGMDLSIQTIIFLVIAVVILVSLIVFFTKYGGSLFGSIGVLGGAGSNATESAAEGVGTVIEGLGS